MVFGSPLKQADSSMKMSTQKKNFYRWAVNEPKERGHICEKTKKELKQHGGKAVLIVNAGPQIPRAAGLFIYFFFQGLSETQKMYIKCIFK